MSLTQKINEFRQSFYKNVPEEAVATMDQETEKLLITGIAATALKEADTLPAFTLPDHKGNLVSSTELLNQGPLVINFYRGGWCPYCNLELKAFIDQRQAINELGGQLVAITPEKPEASVETAQNNQLDFPILSDINADYARKLGLVFTLPESLRPIYQGFGIDIEKHNGAGRFDLPLPATYVVNSSGTIVYAFVNADYTKRAEPAEVVVVLERIMQTA